MLGSVRRVAAKVGRLAVYVGQACLQCVRPRLGRSVRYAIGEVECLLHKVLVAVVL